MKCAIILLLAGLLRADVTITLPVAGEITRDASWQKIGAGLAYKGAKTALGGSWWMNDARVGSEHSEQHGWALNAKYWPGKAFYRMDYRYSTSRDEHAVTADIGRPLFYNVMGAAGYVASYRARLYHMGILKIDVPLWLGKHQLVYRYHARTDFGVSGERDYEWWQQWEYKLPVGEFMILRCFGLKNRSNISFRYQLDRQFGFTEREYGVDINLIHGRE